MSASDTGRYRQNVTPLNDAEGERDIFFAAVEKTRMPMVVTDPRRQDNPIVLANSAFLHMTGYAMQEVIGANCRFLQGPETDLAAVAALRDAMEARREIALEILNYRKDGSTFWNALFVSPVFDARGELMYFFASQLDVSRRRDAEEALGQMHQLEANGQLRGSVAHAFDHLLQVMAVTLDRADRDLSMPDPDRARLRRGMDSVRSAATRVSMLMQQLPASAPNQRLYGRTVNLNLLTENLTELLRRTLDSRITLRTELAADLWNCQVDPTQTEVALLNVLVNARDAMPDGGLLTLRSRNDLIGEAELAAHAGLRPGRHVCIAISDSGTGIAPDLLNCVRDPSCTAGTEGQEHGSGLGLSMVHGLARQSGGAVRIDSEVGLGTTVRLYFPAWESKGPMPAPGKDSS